MEEKKQEHTHIDIYILIVVLVVLGGLLYVFVSRKNAPSPLTSSTVQTQENDEISGGNENMQVNEKPIPTATPQPKPIPKGKTDFFVSVGNNVKGPRMGKGTIDPYDPGVNAQQTMTIEVSDTVPVEKVIALLKTDNKTSSEMMLSPVPGTKNWKGTWTVDDSYLYTYQLTIKATSASGTSSVDVLLR